MKSPEPLTVEPVASRGTQDAFVAFPHERYRADPHWVPPLRVAERQRWSPAHNASLEGRRHRRFIARRGRTLVGRVAAVLDEEFARHWASGTGFFGFFECADDAEAARALLAAAGDTLRGYGCTGMLGPVNLTTHDEVGLLVEGFDSPPMLLSPYNPPGYADLLVGAGLSPAHAYHSYLWDPKRPAPAATERRAAIPPGDAEDGSYRLRRADPRRWSDENRILWRLYNQAFATQWGFVPLRWDEHRQRADSFRPFFRPELAIFAEVAGEPVGFGIALPDINEALAAVAGRLWPLGWLKLQRGIPRIRSARLILLGVRPEFRARGLGFRIGAELMGGARELGLLSAELSLVRDSNRDIQRIIDAVGGRRLKTYRLYRKALVPDSVPPEAAPNRAG